ncbi:hypothetical protein Tsubulata_025567 [Turnera subulata]|uniref:Classical arabinogalactan protein 26-like n=1 Tax=Turnera subulata TaxID=218843 RepID=A0A9Q0GCF3_9ROSI|nr:hypothetical protein Tsubulata_025567 [Turnera subulata]
MASFWSLMAMFMAFMAHFSSLALSSHVHIQLSTISAAPAFLPDSAPLSSPPSLSPDIEPLFPTPKGEAPAPSDSSLPTIPSSPSPPNPDNMLAPGPESGISPSRAMPVSASVSVTPSGPISLAVLICFMVFELMQVPGV